jgi:predicted phage terminase large subunit-like protein
VGSVKGFKTVGLKDAAKDLLRIREAKSGIIAYIRYIRSSGLPDFNFEPAAHHLLIAQILESLARRDHDRAAISLPPGSAKSFYSSVVFPTYLAATNPKLKILCVSNSEGLAEDFSSRRRRIFRSEEWQRLSGTAMMSDSQSLAKQRFPEGGGVWSAGAGTTITGFRADYLIGDDLITGHEQAGSLTQLDKLWNWYLTEARSRITPDPVTQEEGVELLIATRWHLADPIGRVLRLSENKHENWAYVKVPMECNSKDDPLGREIGERLWPNYFTARMVKDAKRTPMMWQTLYQQEPAVSENAWVSVDHIRVIPRDELPMVRTYIGADIALSVKKNDWTVFMVFGVDERKQLYIIDVIRVQQDSDATSKKLVALCAQHSPVSCWIDNDNTSIMWARLVTIESKEQGIPVPLHMSKMKNRDKETRAAPMRTLFMQDRVTIVKAPWNADLFREMSQFPDGRNDDQIDAMSTVGKELYRLSAPKIPQERKVKPIEGNMQMVGGRVMTRQTVKDIFNLGQPDKRNRRI